MKFKQPGKTVTLLTALGAVLLLQSCTLPRALEPKNTASVDNADRFKNWWNFYERGRERMLAGNIVGAGEDFERCLGLRSGARFSYPHPAWRVRSYGLFFVENYFPNRELGVSYYLQGRYAEAEPLLLRSHDALPTERAAYYLNRSRQELVRGIPLSKPRIHIQGGSEDRWVQALETSLQGQMQGEAWVAEWSLAGHSHVIERADKTVSFNQQLSLSPGKNVLNIKSCDLAGQCTTQDILVYADVEPPVLLVRSISPTAAGLVFKGVVRDNLALKSVKVDDQQPFDSFTPSLYPETAFDYILPRAASGQFTATDRAGNQLSVDLRAVAAEQLRASARSSRWAALASDAGTIVPVGSTLPDALRPVIDLKGQPEHMVLYQPFIYIDASISDHSGLAEVTLNGTPWLPADKRGMTSVHFEHYFSPDEGTNRLVIAAVDLQGNRQQTELTIVKKVPSYLWYSHRLKTAITPVINDQRNWDGETIRLLLEHHLQFRPAPYKPRFFMVPTDEAFWQQILQERQISLSDLADDRIRLNHQMTVQVDLLMKAQQFKDRGGQTVLAKVIDQASGEILHMDDVYSEVYNEDPDAMVAALATRLERHFPMIQGRIQTAGRSRIDLALAETQGLDKGARFLVVRSEGPIESGQLQLDSQSRPLELTVQQIGDGSAKGKVINSGEYRVQTGDYVFTR